MKIKNPFEILGLSQSIVRELGDEELAEMAKNNYRRLAMKHHPDKGGRPEKFSALKDAYDKIDYATNQKSFQYMKEQYLKVIPQKKQMQELETKMQHQDSELKTTRERFLDSLISPALKNYSAYGTIEMIVFNEHTYQKSARKKYPAEEYFLAKDYSNAGLERKLAHTTDRIAELEEKKQKLEQNENDEGSLLRTAKARYAGDRAQYREVKNRRQIMKKKLQEFQGMKKKFRAIETSSAGSEKKITMKYALVLENQMAAARKSVDKIKGYGPHSKKQLMRAQEKYSSLREESALVKGSGSFTGEQLRYFSGQTGQYLTSLNEMIHEKQSGLDEKKTTEETYGRGEKSYVAEKEMRRDKIRKFREEKSALRAEERREKRGKVMLEKKIAASKRELTKDRRSEDLADAHATLRIQRLWGYSVLRCVYELENKKFKNKEEVVIGFLQGEDASMVRKTAGVYRPYGKNWNDNFPIGNGITHPSQEQISNETPYIPVSEKLLKSSLLNKIVASPKEGMYLLIAKIPHANKEGKSEAKLPLQFYLRGRITKIKGKR